MVSFRNFLLGFSCIIIIFSCSPGSDGSGIDPSIGLVALGGNGSTDPGLPGGSTIDPEPYLRYGFEEVPSSFNTGKPYQIKLEIQSIGPAVMEEVYITRTEEFLPHQPGHSQLLAQLEIDSATTDYSIHIPCNFRDFYSGPYTSYYYLYLKKAGIFAPRMIRYNYDTVCSPVEFRPYKIADTALAGGEYEVEIRVIGGGNQPATGKLYISKDSHISQYSDHHLTDVLMTADEPVKRIRVRIPPERRGTQYIKFLDGDTYHRAMITVLAPTPVPVKVSGIVGYEFVRADTVSRKLDPANIVVRPARNVRVQLLDSDGAVLDETDSEVDGSYNLEGSVAAAFRIQMVSVMKKTALPSFDVVVKQYDEPNTGSKLHSVVSEYTENTCENDCELNLTALDSNRGSGPFSILDAIRTGMDRIHAIDASISFPQLAIFWKNGGYYGSYFSDEPAVCKSGNQNCMVVLGYRTADSDEYDWSVILHEFVHYLEANFSRSDSLGGGHGPGDLLDPRVSYGEGMANAFSGIMRESNLYIDTAESGGFVMDLESPASTQFKGFYSEASVQKVIWDLFDANNESDDQLSLSFDLLYNVMLDQKSVLGFISIHEYIKSLKVRNPAGSGDIDAILAMEGIAADYAVESSIQADTADVSYSYIRNSHECDGSTVNWPFAPYIVEVNGSGAGAFEDDFDFGLPEYGAQMLSQWCGSVIPSPNKLFGARFFHITPDYSGTMYAVMSEYDLKGNNDVEVFIWDTGVKLKHCENLGEEYVCALSVEAGKTYLLELRLNESCFERNCYLDDLMNSGAEKYFFRIDLPAPSATAPVYPCADCRYLFVTGQNYPGNFGGIGNADELCMQNMPENLQGSGEYKAMLVDDSNRIATTYQASGVCNPDCEGRKDWVLQANKTYYDSYYLASSKIGTTNEHALFNLPLDEKINHGIYDYWTGFVRVDDWLHPEEEWGAERAWNSSSYYTCNNWTTTASNKSGSYGNSYDKDEEAFGYSRTGCDETRHLLCVQQ